MVWCIQFYKTDIFQSGGYLYGTSWEKRTEQIALKLIEKSVRGTISNRLKPAVASDSLKLNAEVEKVYFEVLNQSKKAQNKFRE